MVLKKRSVGCKYPQFGRHSNLVVLLLLISSPLDLVFKSTPYFTHAFITPSSLIRHQPPTGIRGGKITLQAQQDRNEESKSTLSASTFNLVKACVGSGVLALPAGVAAMGDSPSL